MASISDASVICTEATSALFFKHRIDTKVLDEIVEDLEIEDLISIVFLFTNLSTNVDELIKIIKVNSQAAFLKLKYEKEWQEKFLEVLVLTGNINIIKKLGYNNNEIIEMRREFCDTVHNVSPRLNRVVKSLYFLCKNLNKSETKNIIHKINEILDMPVELDKNENLLEFSILHWLNKKYFTIDEKNPKLEDFIKNLRVTDCLVNLPTDFNFDCWKTVTNRFDNENFYDTCLKNETSFDDKKCVKRLCIIINEFDYPLTKDSRKGSEEDVKNLRETFEGCEFEVLLRENLKKVDMIKLLESLNEELHYKEYNCIFMCISSHGSKEEILLTDNKRMPIEIIEKMFCCKNLKDTLKCIILQSCQGNKIGITNRINETNDTSKIVTDGLEDKDPLYHKNYVLFQATITGYKAFRDETKGSWFIQDLCKVIKENSPIKIQEWTQKVSKLVSERREKSRCEDKLLVQLPRTENSLIEDFFIPLYKKKKLN